MMSYTTLPLSDNGLVHNIPELLRFRVEMPTTIMGNFKKTPVSFSIRSIFILIALNAGWPYLNPAMKFFGDNPFLKYYSGASVVFALGSVSAWSVFDYYEYLCLRKYASKNSQLFEFLCMASAFFFGVLSALPGAVITLNYNSDYLFLALAVFLDVSTNTAALNRLFREIYINFRYSNNFHLRSARAVILEQIELCEASTTLAIDGSTTLDTESIVSKLKLLIEETKPCIDFRSNHANTYHVSRKIFVLVLSSLLPAPWEITAGYLAYNEVYQLTNSRAFSIILTLLSVVPTYTLEFIFAHYLMNHSFILLADFYYKNNSYPSTTKNSYLILGSIVFAMLLVGLSFTARAEVVIDTFPPSVSRNLLLACTIFGTLIFKFTPTIGNIQRAYSSCDKEQSYQYQKSFLKDFSIILKNSTPQDTQKILQHIYPEGLVLSNSTAISTPSIVNNPMTHFHEQSDSYEVQELGDPKNVY